MGSIQNAQQGFDTLEYRNDMSCYALISGYLRQGKPHLAFSSYLKMQDDYGIKLSGRTFVALLKACLTLQDFAKGLEIHADIARLGLLETDAFVGSMLVDFYTKCGSVHKARQVFNKVKNRDVVLWNTLMTGYVNHGLGEEAFHCFKQLQLEDIQPNVVTFICTLKACGLIGSSEKCLAIHVEIERRDLYKTNHLLGTTLVDTYSKCGCVVKAQAVFNALPTHNVVSWTALIPGYADQEHGQAALAAFADMQVEGISPNSVTYICLLKACGCQKALEVGQELHCEIARMDPLYNDLKIGNALVDMYAKCGILDVAHELFDELARKDVVSWNIILAGYVEEELFEETFHCFGHMQVVPDNLTFITVLRACANSKSIIRGQLLHAEIDKKGLFQGEPVIGNALVDMYAKCGLFEEAEQVFDDISSQDVLSWNALLVGYTEHKHSERVLELFEQMKHAGVCADMVSFICSLKACANIGSGDLGEQIHAEIEKLALLSTNPSIANALVDMYAKCGLLSTSQYLFFKLSVRHPVAWNALILGYADHGYGDEALELYEEMQLHKVLPDLVTFVGLLKACGSLRDINQGRDLHVELARQNMLDLDISVGNSLVDMYAKCHRLSFAQEVFDRLRCKDTVSWNVLLTGYTDNSQGDIALKELKKMKFLGVSPDDVTFVTCLQACSSVGAVYEGQTLHSQIEEMGFFNCTFINSQLVDMYVNFGLLMDAQHIFNKLLVHDICQWNVLIAGYSDHGHHEKALKCLEQLQSKGVPPDILTFDYSLKSCGNLGAIDKGMQLHQEVVKKGLLAKDTVLGNTLISMYVKCGSLEVAQSVFDRLLIKDIGSWNAMIAGYDELDNGEDVFLFFEDMLQEGIKPDSITFILILNACSRRGLRERATQYFKSMSSDYGIDPSAEHHTCMLDLLGRTGHLHKVMASINELSLSPDLAILHTVLGACGRLGNAEVGRQVFMQAFSLEK